MEKNFYLGCSLKLLENDHAFDLPHLYFPLPNIDNSSDPLPDFSGMLRSCC